MYNSRDISGWYRSCWLFHSCTCKPMSGLRFHRFCFSAASTTLPVHTVVTIVFTCSVNHNNHLEQLTLLCPVRIWVIWQWSMCCPWRSIHGRISLILVVKSIPARSWLRWLFSYLRLSSTIHHCQPDPSLARRMSGLAMKALQVRLTDRPLWRETVSATVQQLKSRVSTVLYLN